MEKCQAKLTGPRDREKLLQSSADKHVFICLVIIHTTSRIAYVTGGTCISDSGNATIEFLGSVLVLIGAIPVILLDELRTDSI